MSDKEILEKAIKLAVSNGWNCTEDLDNPLVSIEKEGICNNGYDLPIITTADIIFNKDFAKSLWGKGLHEVTATYMGKPLGKMDWEWHLQQMVVADDPLAYLAKNI